MKLNLPELLTTYRDGLLNDTLPFWFPRAVDTEHGGFLHCFDRDGSLLDTDKSVWVQGRMAWMLLTLHNTVEKRPEWLEWARGGLEFIDRHCFDMDGRMFFHVTREGRVSTSLKGNLWKSFFHHPRMQWTCWQLLKDDLNPKTPIK